MCIYLGEQPTLHYDSGEHIIPAGLGGIKRLPREFVSTEFNNYISKLERDFMHRSVLSLPRNIFGPGKRGSLSDSKASKSEVHVQDQLNAEGNYGLGYIKLGKPFQLPQIVVNTETGVFTVSVPNSLTDEDLMVFKDGLNNFSSLNTRFIISDVLPISTFILGIQKGLESSFECFIACPTDDEHPFTQEWLMQVSNTIQGKTTFTGHVQSLVRTYQSVEMGDNFFRCAAKIAFNCLADLRGKEFVMQTCFDSVRNWIVGSGEGAYNFATAPAEVRGIYPNDSHHILISKVNTSLMAIATFYNHFQVEILLANDFAENFLLDGMVCDWRKRQEFRLYEYYASLIDTNSRNDRGTIN